MCTKYIMICVDDKWVLLYVHKVIMIYMTIQIHYIRIYKCGNEIVQFKFWFLLIHVKYGAYILNEDEGLEDI